MYRASSICRNKNVSSFWLMLNDLKGLLLRFSRGDDLATDTGAGRYEHNIKLIPFYLAALLHTMSKLLEYIYIFPDNE